MSVKNKNSYFKLPILDGLACLDAKQHTIHFPFHTHNTFNITLVLEQAFSTKLSNRFLQAPVGTIVVTNPDEVHASICDSKLGSSFFTFYVSPDVLFDLNHKKPVCFQNKIINDPILFQQLLHLSQRFAGTGAAFEIPFVQALKRLVLQHSTEMYEENRHNTNFRKYLAEEGFEKFNLEDSAQKFGLDKFKFLRLFKYETGLTPNNYIILKRIEKCKELLLTNNDLLDIAIQTGFYDATHLCKHFKKITGITPLAYRNA